MRQARLWLIPLCVALLIDAVLVFRYQTASGTAVGRAVMRTVGGGGCRVSLLARLFGMDDLLIVDSWSLGDKSETLQAQPLAFAAAQGVMTQQSQALIDQGIELQRDPESHPPMLAGYLSQIRRGQSWLTGECTPYANPFRSRLRPVGTMTTADGTYRVYRGISQTDPGPGRLPKADVWIGVRRDGRLGFELLRQIPTTPVDPGSLVTLVKVFTYPTAHLDSLVTWSADARTSFYQQDYHDLLVTMQQAEEMPAH